LYHTPFFNDGKVFFYPRPQDIDTYSKEVKKGRIKLDVPACPVCNTNPEHFKRHDARTRQLYIPVEQIIQTICCLLVRWRCPGCNKRILQYPDFVLPYKRYPLQTILDYASRYTENERATYQSVIQSSPIGYPEDERQLTPSTPWRWIATLGKLTHLLNRAQHLILQADAAGAVTRHLAALTLPPKKYRTTARKTLLIQCRKLLHTEAACRNLFDMSLFPNLATTSGFS